MRVKNSGLGSFEKCDLTTCPAKGLKGPEAPSHISEAFLIRIALSEIFNSPIRCLFIRRATLAFGTGYPALRNTFVLCFAPVARPGSHCAFSRVPTRRPTSGTSRPLIRQHLRLLTHLGSQFVASSPLWQCEKGTHATQAVELHVALDHCERDFKSTKAR